MAVGTLSPRGNGVSGNDGAISPDAEANRRKKALLQLIIAVGITAILGTLTTLRYKHAGSWLPDNVPATFGAWEGVDAPVPQSVLAMLSNPDAVGRKYYSPFSGFYGPFGETVEASVITAGEFENYHDPTVCVPGNGFVLTSLKILHEGDWKIRAMIFKREDPRVGPLRMLMYYWQQTRDGQTDTAARMGNYRDIDARFQTGFGAVVLGKQTVLCRVYTYISPDDTNGAQAQRNVHEISRAIYNALKKDGASKG